MLQKIIFYRSSIAFVIIACGVLFQTSAQSQNSIIEQIEIQTPNNQLKKNLENLTKKYLYKRYLTNTKDRIKQKIISYLLTNQYRNSTLKGPFVQSKENKIFISFQIQNPYQYQFIIKNNTQIKRAALIRSMKLTDTFYQPNFIQTALRRLKEHYISQGFQDIKITHKTIKNKDYLYQVICNLSEGQRFLIKKIAFTGSFSKNKDHYVQLFFSYASPLLKSKIYIPKDFDRTLKKMVNHLRQSGFLNAKIHHKNIQKIGKNVFIEIFLSENDPIVVRDIKITGNKIFSKKKIQEIIKIQKNFIFNMADWELGISRLIQTYRDKGFFSAHIPNQNRMLKIHRSLKTVDIHIQLKEGDPSFVHDIQVKGNLKIKSSFIIHSSGLKKGLRLTSKDIQKAKDFIDDLEIFSNVQVYPVVEKHNKTIVVIEVAERNFRFFRASPGGSTKHTFSINLPIEYIEKRFLSLDDSELKLKAQLSSNIQLLLYSLQAPSPEHITFSSIMNHFLDQKIFEYELSGSFKKYYISNTRLNAQVSYLRSDRIFSFPQLINKEPLSNFQGVQWEKLDQITLNLEKKFDLNTILNFKILEFNVKESRTSGNDTPILNQDNQIISLTGFSLFIDRRNHVFYPTSGQMLISSLDYSGPILGTNSSIHFLRTEAKYYFYIPLISDQIILAQSLNGGYAHRFGSSGIPISHLFILGGINSLRGFDGAINGDRIPSQEELSIQGPNDIIYQSSFYFLTKNEIRFPLYKNILRGAVFYDGGSVYLSKTNLKKSYRHSVGFGLHYGLLAINVGFKLNPFPNESLFHINFHIGAF